MNVCYCCEALIDRAPSDGKRRICEKCLKNPPNVPPSEMRTGPRTRDYWTNPIAQRQVHKHLGKRP